MLIAIVEDTAAEQLRLREYTERYCAEHELEAEILLFPDGSDLLENYPEGLDLALLDIEMPKLGGLDAARALRKFDRQVQILFVTYLAQYAIEGYSVDAADFIVKPVAYPAFCASMDRVMDKLRFFTPRFLMTSYAKKPVSCQVQQIAFIESLNKRTIIHLLGGEELRSSEPLYALEEKLEGETFFRCHNAYLVNLSHVKSVAAGELSVPGQQIPISKYRKKEFLQCLAACRGRML